MGNYLNELLSAHITQMNLLRRFGEQMEMGEDWIHLMDICRRLFLAFYRDINGEKYFHPFEDYMHPEKCEIFVCHNQSKCIRKFNNFWYLVDVITIHRPGGVIKTDSPDNYPLHRFPDSIPSAEYAEELMVKIIIDQLEKEG